MLTQPPVPRTGSAALHRHPAVSPLSALLLHAKGRDNAPATHGRVVLRMFREYRASSKVSDKRHPDDLPPDNRSIHQTRGAVRDLHILLRVVAMHVRLP